jgi:peptidoglycan/LPS O-acetylase OafA/YrhL
MNAMQQPREENRISNRFEHFKQLDGLRGLSIILVLFGHLADFSWGLNSPPYAFGEFAGLGVLLFFLLSGFLITGLLLNEEINTGCISLRRFYVRRVLRIMPAFYVMLGFVILLMHLGFVTDVPLYTLPITAFYLRDLAGRGLTLSHTWSLALEEQFYLLWPVFLARVRCNRLLVVCLVAAVAPICRAGAFYTGTYEPWHYARPYFWWDAILVGCGIAIVWTCHRGALTHWSQKTNAGIVFIALILWTLVGAGSPSAEPFLRTGQVALGALLIVNLVAGRESLFSKILCSPVICWFGKISYSLYLWQQLFLVTKTPSWGLWRIWPIDLLCSILLASVSYYVVERQFLRLKQRWEPITSNV